MRTVQQKGLHKPTLNGHQLAKGTSPLSLLPALCILFILLGNSANGLPLFQLVFFHFKTIINTPANAHRGTAAPWQSFKETGLPLHEYSGKLTCSLSLQSARYITGTYVGQSQHTDLPIPFNTVLRGRRDEARWKKTKTSLRLCVVSFEIKDASDLLKSAHEEQARLWGPIIRKQGVVLLVGSSDTGKSSWLRQFAYCIATGAEELCGYSLYPTHRRAGYISTEDGDSDVAIALKKLHDAGVDAEQLRGRLHFMFGFANQYDDLKRFLRENPVDVLMVDCIADLAKGSMNDLTTVRQIMLPFKEIAREFNCAVIMMHHTVKNSEAQGPDKRLVNGSQAIEAVPRCVIELRKGNASNQRNLSVLKCNYLSSEWKAKSMVLQFDEQRLSFTKVGEAGINGGDLPKAKYTNGDVLKRLIELKSKGLSFEKLRPQLVADFGEEHVPGFTRLKELFNQWLKNNGPSPDDQGESPTDQGGPILVIV